MSFEREVEKEINPRTKFPMYCTNFDNLRATILAPTRRSVTNEEQVPFSKVLPGPFVAIGVPSYEEIKKDLESKWPLLYKSIGLGNPSESMYMKELLINYDLSINQELAMLRKFTRGCPLAWKEAKDQEIILKDHGRQIKDRKNETLRTKKKHGLTQIKKS